MPSIKKNFIYNCFYQILSIVLPLITAPYISRLLGVENIGIYSYTYSYAHYFVLFAMLGLKNYGSRSIAMARDNKEKLSQTFWSIYGLQVAVSAIVIVCYIGYLFFFVGEEMLVSGIWILYVISAQFDISWFFFGIEKFKITVLRSTCVSLMSVICIFLFVKSIDDLWKYVLIMALTKLLNPLTLWPFLKQYVHWVKPSGRAILHHLKPNLILFTSVVAISLYNLMDKIMLGSISTMTESGYYEYTEQIVNIPFGIITALGTVMLPRISNMMASGKSNEVNRYMRMSMKYVMCIACALAFGLAGIAPVLAPVYFGKEYIPCAALITAIAPSILFKSWASVIRTQYLIPAERDKEYITSVILGAVINIVINAMLISYIGAMGAVIGTVAAEIVVCWYQTYTVRKEISVWVYFKNSSVFLAFGLGMFVLVRYTGGRLGLTIQSLILGIIIGAAFYLAMCAIYFLWSKDDLVWGYIQRFQKNRKK